MIAMKKTAFEVTMPVLIAALAGGAGVILLVGLLCGLVARPNNCINPPTLPSTPTTTRLTTTTGPVPSATTTPGASATTTPGASATTTPGPSATTTPGPSATTTRTNPPGTTGTPGATSPGQTTPVSPGSVTTPAQTTFRTLPTLTSSTEQPFTRTPVNITAFRLPKTVSTNKYNLLLKFDYNPFSKIAEPLSPKSLGYEGEVTIEFTATQASTQIVLHMDRNVILTDPNIVVRNTGTNQQVGVVNSNYDTYQVYRINLAGGLVAGANYLLNMKFRARTTVDGFYFHGYEEINQRERSILGTRFLPNRARTAFPCFDEPGFKARFTITIEHPERSVAVSNFPSVSSQTFNDGTKNKIRTAFQETNPISTYSVGWAVIPNDFGAVSRTLPALNTVVTVHGRASEINVGLGDFALDVADQTLNALFAYSGVRDAVPPKIDLIALPYFPDFSSPSWGLNGFTEDDLFYSESVNSKADKQFTAEVVAKEMAHNWFGNYITCDYWDDAWIQEGLAHLFQYRVLDGIFPDWDLLDQFLVENTIPVMWLDGYESAVPLKFTIVDNLDIKYLFTDLLYKKSAALMRMFSTAYGETIFKNGLANILTSRPYGVITFDDFANSFSSPSGWPISTKEYLEPWVTLHNLPQVTAILDDDTGNTRVTFIQERFLLAIILGETDFETDFKWPVYLECKAGGSPGNPLGGSIYDFAYLLTSASGSIQLPNRYDWVKCNKDFNGYYITDYGDPQYLSFETVILNSLQTLTIADRVNLIHNAFELAWLGTSSYAAPTTMIVYLEFFERNLAPWKAFFYHVDRIATVTEHRESFRNLRTFVNQQIVDAIYEFNLDIYTDSADHLEELLKIEFAQQLGRLQNVQALNKFTELFRGINPVYFIDPNNIQLPLSSNIRALTYKYHLQNSYQYNDWFELYSFFFITNDVREQRYALDALGNTRLFFFFDFILDELLFSPFERIPIEYAPVILTSIGTNPTGRYYAWYYMREYWGDFFLRGADMRKLSEAMYATVESFDNTFLLEELERFILSSYDFETADIRLRMQEAVINNYIWVDDREEEFELFFFELNR